MRTFRSATTLFAAAAFASPSSPPSYGHGPGHSGKGCSSLTTHDITTMGNNSLFTRWRPQSRFMAPAGFMNDPCGAMYDPVRDTYHLSYQWHPQHINWGNISWGTATSKDLITWTDHGSWRGSDALQKGPSGNGSYDGLGVFSGTAQSVNLKGEQDGTLLAFYTSVSRLPTGWAIEYQPYTETQSLLISKDGGKTWKDYEKNPVIDATTLTAPMYWNLTGMRDPFFEPLPELDAVLGVSEPHYYTVLGSGIKGVGPRIPLWTAASSDLTKWSFLGALWEPKANTSLGTHLSTGSYGFNFEVTGLFTLPDSKGNKHWFVNMGSEGGGWGFHPNQHWALWHGGSITRRTNGSAAFEPSFGGSGDWGNGYALTSFNDTKHNRRVQYAWIPEDLVDAGGLFSAQQQGFQGAYSLPREIFIHEVHNVKNSPALSKSKSALIQGNTALTLGVRPLSDVVAGIRKGAKHNSYKGSSSSSSKILSQASSKHMELKATISSTTGAVGLRVLVSPDGGEYTTIMYEPSNSTILVERLHSSKIVGFNNDTVTGYFQPYTVNGKTEPITMNVFLDGSVVEIYVNDRFALSTRAYPSNSCSTGFGTYVAPGAKAKFASIETWVGTKNVWPKRPANSSSPLVYDTPAQTDDYLWWDGR